MKGLREKFRKNEGFTMVELLIVVAIIGILAAVSIPLFSNALEKARHGVDAANIRSAVSMANAEAVVQADPATYFGEDGKVYDYIVDNVGDHQAELVPEATGNAGAKMQCSEATSTTPTLKVKIAYDADGGDKLIDKIVVTTNWVVDSTSKEGHYKVDDKF